MISRLVIEDLALRRGERLALVNNRKLAFALAREHDFSPVSAH